MTLFNQVKKQEKRGLELMLYIYSQEKKNLSLLESYGVKQKGTNKGCKQFFEGSLGLNTNLMPD